jgi:hypothetical protein
MFRCYSQLLVVKCPLKIQRKGFTISIDSPSNWSNLTYCSALEERWKIMIPLCKHVKISGKSASWNKNNKNTVQFSFLPTNFDWQHCNIDWNTAVQCIIWHFQSLASGSTDNPSVGPLLS